MRKILKIIGITVGILLVLLVAAAVALPLLVDPNDFKPRVITAVKDATGRDLEIPGDVRLSVFPWLGVELGTVRMGNAAGFGDEPFASIEGVQVRVKLLPLLRREVEIGKVVVEQPVIRLARDAQGRGNWEDLGNESAADPETAETATAQPPDFSIDGIAIRGAHIIYTDASTRQSAELTEFDLETGRIALPADFALSASGTAKLGEPELATAFEFRGQVMADPDARKYRFGDAALHFSATGATLPTSPLEGQVAWQQLGVDLNADTATVQGLMLKLLGVETRVEASASGISSELAAEGEIRVAEFSPGQLLVRLGQELPATRDGGVLDRASFTASFEATSDSVAVGNLKAVLDQSNLTGTVAITSFATSAMRFDLSLDEIDVDRYLPAGDEAAATEAEAGALDEIEIPAELVRGRDVVGKLAIAKLKAFDFNSTDVNIGITARNDRLRIHPAEAKFYGGGYRGDMQLDASGEVPAVSVDEHVDRVQLAPMVKDFLEVENISGTARIDVKAAAQGHTVGDLRKTLEGSFGMDVQDGAIEGFNLWETIRGAYAKLKGRSHDSSAALQRTEFAELSATGTISKGVLHNDDLVASLPFLRVAGKGEIDIAAATLDYLVEATVLKSPELAGGIEELSDTAIPVRLTGPLAAPKVRPDVQGVLEAKAKAALDRKEQELRDEARRKAEEEKKRLEDKLKDKLRGLRD